MWSSARRREPPASAEPVDQPVARWGYGPEHYRLGQAIRRAYRQARSRHETNATGSHQHYHPSRQFDGGIAWDRLEAGETPESDGKPPVWLKLGKLCADFHFEPQRLVGCFFNGLTLFARAPLPYDILNHRDLQNLYRQRPAQLKAAYHHRLKSELTAYRLCRQQWQVLAPELEGSELRRDVLMDSRSSLTSLFRYCLAHRFRKPCDLEVCRRFFRPAAWQYLVEPELYDAAWGNFIPRRFRQRARQLED